MVDGQCWVEVYDPCNIATARYQEDGSLKAMNRYYRLEDLWYAASNEGDFPWLFVIDASGKVSANATSRTKPAWSRTIPGGP